MSETKKRTRLFYAGKATYRHVTPDRGWGGYYGQTRRPAKWACIDCGRVIDGDDDKPWIDFAGAYGAHPCTNGHSPCKACGKQIPRLNCGCPREHQWNLCPGKTKADRQQPQHAHVGHLHRPEATS